MYMIMKKKEKIVTIWFQFWNIYNDVKENLLTPLEIKERTAFWLALFLQVYFAEKITPYIHAFVHHLHEFVELYGDVNLFNQQGLEKLNDQTTTQFFRGTNKKEYLKQLLNKRNRMEVNSKLF